MKNWLLYCSALPLISCANDPAPQAPVTWQPLAPVLQTQKLSGFLMAAPAGITANVNGGAIFIKPAGFAPGSSSAPTGLPWPDFKELPASVAKSLGSGTTEPPLLAMSMGLDVMEFDLVNLTDTDLLDGTKTPIEPGKKLPVARLKAGSHGWLALQFAVDSEQLAVPDAELAPDVLQAKASGQLDATVFSFLLPGSTAVMLPNETESVRAFLPSAIGLSAGDRIDALNMHTALYQSDIAAYQNVFTTHPLSPHPVVYFTLRPEFLQQLPAASTPPDMSATPLDAATIYMSRWDGAWQQPTVYATIAHLELSREDAVIDGLAIDAETPGVEYLASNGDRVMFSLASSNLGTVPVEQQLLLALHGGGPPRRVVYKDPVAGGHGTLSRRMKVGRGLADFCTVDPSLRKGLELFDLEYVIDDFVVARRLAPDHAHVWPPSIVSLAPGAIAAEGWPFVSAEGKPVTQPAPLPPDPTLPFDAGQVFVGRPPHVLLPGGKLLRVLPELGLAIAGYRHLRDDRPYMRACMSWPYPLAKAGRASVRWGIIEKFYEPTTKPGNISWLADEDREYVGEPLFADRLLPADGLLRPNFDPTTDERQHRAFVAQWRLVTPDGRIYVSPIAALRF